MSFVMWCPGRDLNPHSSFEKTDFKSVASADFATRAWVVAAFFPHSIACRPGWLCKTFVQTNRTLV